MEQSITYNLVTITYTPNNHCMLTPTQIKNLCEQFGLSPSKQYGQNYLISEAPIKKMIDAATVSAEDTIVEIGPGFGILTLALAPRVRQVIAFEIEKKLTPYWQEKQQEYGNIEVVWGNVLQALPSRLSTHLQPYKVLANLPYQITSDAIRLLLELEHQPEIIILMVQKEVAERIAAKPGDMSLLSVAVQYYGQVSIVAQVSRGSFWPSPKVDSALIAIVPAHNSRTRQETQWFFRVARAGFAHKRKQLWRNLSEGLHLPGDVVKGILSRVVENEKIRAEEVGVPAWREIAQLLASQQ